MGLRPGALRRFPDFLNLGKIAHPARRKLRREHFSFGMVGRFVSLPGQRRGWRFGGNDVNGVRERTLNAFSTIHQPRFSATV